MTVSLAKRAANEFQAFDFGAHWPDMNAQDIALDLDGDIGAIDLTETGEIGRAKKQLRADEATGLSPLPKFRRRTEKRVMLDLSQIKNAAEKIASLPANEETLHCITGGDHTGWDIVPAIHRLMKRPIQELIISTLGFSTHNIACLCEMFDRGEIQKASLLCGDFFAKGSTPFYNYAVQEFEKRGLKLRAMRNHSKVVLIKAGFQAYVIETSANLRSCNNLEQFTLTRSRPLFDFHKAWLTRVLEFGA